ncbi:MAG: penicillin-binding protein 1C [Alphaproteobacteria bacterium]|nr:penicillin-binding protein 1C [Alphaproteobacteria bacterium]
MVNIRKTMRWGLWLSLLLLLLIVGKTAIDFTPPYADFHNIRSDANTLQLLDRNGQPLTFSYQDRWNTSDAIALHRVPELLQNAFVQSEDRRFFQHQGVDWIARGSALWDRARRNQATRGASTITEQVVRMIHPRPRTLWSKWMEGLEALALEWSISKPAILEFYLNQVPYAANRHGVVQAARYYFNRDLATLNPKEMLALAVLVRAPSKFDLYAAKIPLEDSIQRLAETLMTAGQIDAAAVNSLADYPLGLDPSTLAVQAVHFVDYVRDHAQQPPHGDGHRLMTTLDAETQQFVQGLLESRLQSLASRHITQAAALVVDHQNHEILAWVSVGAACGASNNQAPGCKIDMVTVPRQPGSALKPFLYAAALEKGWTAATMIEDAPFSNPVGRGIHHFHNYSHSYYGQVSLRSALGNSLNIPALHAINFVTPERYLTTLYALGFTTLRQGADFYDDGLALGNGEVSLLELVQAYSALANRGVFQPLKLSFDRDQPFTPRRVYSPEASSLIGHILSDPWARQLEFGRSSVLNLPTQTAVKTGTSTDYRDAWAVGYNHRFVVGVWMGNADYSPTDGITGSLGPALALRGIFNQLTKNRDPAPLFFSPNLVAMDVCRDGQASDGGGDNRGGDDHLGQCLTRTEYFLPDHLPAPMASPLPSQQANQQAKMDRAKIDQAKIAIARPANNLEMAFDPRVPASKQAFEMHLDGVVDGDMVTWTVDDQPFPNMRGATFLWPMTRGKHWVRAQVWRDGQPLPPTDTQNFWVK